jgi:hypothetical protein
MSGDARVLEAAALLLRKAQMQGRPQHIHHCPDEDHAWPCPSPYCDDVASRPLRCPEHGGELPRDTRPEDFGA